MDYAQMLWECVCNDINLPKKKGKGFVHLYMLAVPWWKYKSGPNYSLPVQAMSLKFPFYPIDIKSSVMHAMHEDFVAFTI